MLIADVVLKYNLEEFCALHPVLSIYNDITHLYFRNQLHWLDDHQKFEEFCDRLRLCNALTSINLANANTTHWDAILEILISLPNLNVINVRDSNITPEQIKQKFGNKPITIINQDSYRFSEYAELSKEEYQEILLVAHAAHLNYPSVKKFSRKRFIELNLPLSVIFADEKPFVLVKNSSLSNDLDIYNDAVSKYSKRIGIVICFKDATINNLSIMLAKVKPHERRSAIHSVTEISELNADRPAYIIERPLKNYRIQPYINTYSVESYLQSHVFSTQYTSKDIRVLNASAIIIAVLEFHARGKVHQDLKPANILMLSNGLMELIDLEATISCEPNDMQVLRRVLVTKSYAPPEILAFLTNNANKKLTVKIGRHTDAFALGLMLQQILILKPYIDANNEYHLTSEPIDPWHQELCEYYSSSIEQLFGTEMRREISALLKSGIQQRSTAENIFNFFNAKYPQTIDLALRLRYRYTVGNLHKSIEANSAFAQWLTQFKNEQRSWFVNLFAALNNNEPDHINFSDVIFVKILSHIYRLFALSRREPSKNLLEFCDRLIRNILYLQNLNPTNAPKFFAAIQYWNNILRLCASEIATKVLCLIEHLIRHNMLTTENYIIASLGILHKRLIALLTTDEPLVDVLTFAIKELDAISTTLIDNDEDMLIRMSIANLINYLHGYLLKIGESSNSHPNPSNPLLFSAPAIIIKNIDRVFSVKEIPMVLDSIFNDSRDSANLGKFLSDFASDKLVIQKLLASGASDLYLHVRNGDLTAVVQKLLNNGYYYSSERNFQLSLDLAFELAFNDKRRKIFSYILEHVKPEDLHIVEKYVNATLIRGADENYDFDLLKILLNVVKKHAVLFADFIRNQLTSLLEQKNKDLILFFVQQGIDPLTCLNKEPTEYKCTITLASCLYKDPYQYFDACEYNLITAAMIAKDYDYVLALLPHVQAGPLASKQLGFHLVVAARNNQQPLVIALIGVGANLNEPYPCGVHANKTLSFFANKHGFENTFDNTQRLRMQ